MLDRLDIDTFLQKRTPITIEKPTTCGGRTKEASERSFVFVHQNGGDEVTRKPLIKLKEPLKLSESRNGFFAEDYPVFHADKSNVEVHLSYGIITEVRPKFAY